MTKEEFDKKYAIIAQKRIALLEGITDFEKNVQRHTEMTDAFVKNAREAIKQAQEKKA